MAKKALRTMGFDVVRFRSLSSILAHKGINLVFDVGANTGQYGKHLRELGYRGKIVSFEPQKQPFATLSADAKRDARWTAVNLGLGNENEQKTINVYEDSRLSTLLSSDHRSGALNGQPVGTETIEIRTLDGIIDQYAAPDDKILLKIDTQGFEKQVLQGAEQSLPKLTSIQIEMSLTPLYDHQPLLDEMVALLRSKGFALWQIQRGLWDPKTGQEIEVDGVFVRAPEATGQS